MIIHRERKIVANAHINRRLAEFHNKGFTHAHFDFIKLIFAQHYERQYMAQF